MRGSGIKSIFVTLIRVVLPICFIAAGVAGWNYYTSTEPKVNRRPPQKTVLMVNTQKFEKKDVQGRIQGMGTVVPAVQIVLKSRVAGEVISVSDDFVRGAVVKKGTVLCRIDDTDYIIELEKAQSALEKTLSDLALEEGSQKVAREEFKLIQQASNGEIESTDLAMRKPQLAQANAAVANARADVKKARLNLERTRVKAPFNGLVLEKKIDAGTLVSNQETLATLVDVDKFYVETLVSPDQVQFLTAGEKNGSNAVIHSAYTNRKWQGRLERFTGEISRESRMAGLLVAVYNPMGLGEKSSGPGLMLNDYVSVELMGQTLSRVAVLPRKWLRDGNTVWIYRDGRLEIRPAQVVWKEQETVYVGSGVDPEDEVVISDIPVPVDGMSLVREQGMSDSDAQPSGNGEPIGKKRGAAGKS